MRADHHQATELALRAGGGVERDAVHPADLGQALLEAVHQLESTLDLRGGRHRVQPREAR